MLFITTNALCTMSTEIVIGLSTRESVPGVRNPINTMECVTNDQEIK